MGSIVRFYTPHMPDLRQLADDIRSWSRELGFQQMGVAEVALGEDETHLRDWLAQGQHGEMGYMARHGDKCWNAHWRATPAWAGSARTPA